MYKTSILSLILDLFLNCGLIGLKMQIPQSLHSKFLYDMLRLLYSTLANYIILTENTEGLKKNSVS